MSQASSSSDTLSQKRASRDEPDLTLTIGEVSEEPLTKIETQSATTTSSKAKAQVRAKGPRLIGGKGTRPTASGVTLCTIPSAINLPVTWRSQRTNGRPWHLKRKSDFSRFFWLPPAAERNSHELPASVPIFVEGPLWDRLVLGHNGYLNLIDQACVKHPVSEQC